MTAENGIAALAAWMAGRPEGDRHASLFWAGCRCAQDGLEPGPLIGAAIAAGLGRAEANGTIVVRPFRGLRKPPGDGTARVGLVADEDATGAAPCGHTDLTLDCECGQRTAAWWAEVKRRLVEASPGYWAETPQPPAVATAQSSDTTLAEPAEPEPELTLF